MARNISTYVSLDGQDLPGIRQTLTVQQPIAGSDWSVTLGQGYYWRPLIIAFTLANAVAVATRVTGLVTTNDEGVSFTIPAANSSTANQTYKFAWVTDFPYSVSNSLFLTQMAGYPRFWLPPGSKIGSVTSSLQAADQYQSISIVAECWDAGPEGERLRTHAPTLMEIEDFVTIDGVPHAKLQPAKAKGGKH